MPANTVSSTRRNGSQASCEPCRKGKVRCDHAKPICSRCRRRGTLSACWYHPAPLSAKRRDGSSPIRSQLTPVSSPGTSTAVEQSERIPTFSDITAQDRAGNAPVFHYWPTLSDEESPLNIQIICQKGFRHMPGPFHEDQIVTAKQIITPLSRLAEIEDLIRNFFGVSLNTSAPEPIVSMLLDLLRRNKQITHYINGRRDAEFVKEVATTLMRKSIPPVPITPTTTPEEFCSHYSGDNLRIETLGLLYSMAARSYCKSYANINYATDDLLGCLVRCSNLCLRLARELSIQNNDIIVSLSFQNLQVISTVKGDTSLSVWRRVNDLATDVVALGIHREATSSADKVPFFLAQSRRMAFTSAYHVDKLFAAILTRPVCLSSRYSDCKPPLDLSDEEVFADPNGSHDPSRFNLTLAGWNRDSSYRQVARIRICYMLSHLREEVIDHQLRPSKTLNVETLKDLASRCDAAWLSVPEHLRFTPEQWPTHLPAKICCVMGKMYLHYLHTHFQIQRMIGKIEGTLMSGLFPIAIKMVATIMKISKTHRTSGIILSDIGETMLGYGLPAAMVLVINLQNNPSTELVGGVKRSDVLRDLVVFVSQIETATHQHHPDHDFCRQAAKGLGPMVDNLLQGVTVSTAENTAANETTVVPSMIQEPSTMSVGFDALGLSDLEAVDFDSWVSNMDWTASNEWTRM